MILNRLILTYISSYLFSDTQAKCFEIAQELHPDWNVDFYSDGDCEAFVRDHYEDLFPLYQWRPRGIQRSDLFRVLAIHHHGGFYLDLDIYHHHALDPLCKHVAVFPLEWKMTPETFVFRHGRPHSRPRELWQLSNYGFGATVGHAFLDAIIEEMIARTEYVHPSGVSNRDVLFTTGPNLLSSVFYENYREFSRSVTLLRGEYAPPDPVASRSCDSHWNQFGRYGNHLMGGSWRAR